MASSDYKHWALRYETTHPPIFVIAVSPDKSSRLVSAIAHCAPTYWRNIMVLNGEVLKETEFVTRSSNAKVLRYDEIGKIWYGTCYRKPDKLYSWTISVGQEKWIRFDPIIEKQSTAVYNPLSTVYNGFFKVIRFEIKKVWKLNNSKHR
jgi:hypothetical protein